MVDAAVLKSLGIELHLLLLHLHEAWHCRVEEVRVTHLAQTFQNPSTPTLSLKIPNAVAVSFCLMRRISMVDDAADHLQSQAFHFVFCHSNLLAPILRL